jgi:hypothetical protein
MAVPLCNAELGCCGSLYSTGATRNGNPDRCCDRGFSLFASSTLTYQRASATLR